MHAGAVGFSTSTSPAHNGEGGRPMPSRLADEAEMRALVGCLREAGRGVFMLTKGGAHARCRSSRSSPRESGRPVVVAALLHNSTNPDAVFKDLRAIAAAPTSAAASCVGAVSCCPLAMEFTLHSPYVFEGLQAWQPALPLKGERYRAKLRGNGISRGGARRDRETGALPPVQRRMGQGPGHRVGARAEFEQRPVAELARAAARDPLDFMLDLALDENLDTVFSALLLNSDEAAVGRMLTHPASLVSLSDAGAHLTFFNDAGFGLHLLGHWVRELGVLTLADAVWRLTGQPARLFGIRERGALKAGYHADLLLFDPATVDRGPKRRVFDLPGGDPRLTTAAGRRARRVGERRAHRRQGRDARQGRCPGNCYGRLLPERLNFGHARSGAFHRGLPRSARRGPSHKAVREVVARAVAEPGAVLKWLGEPKRGEVQKLYHSPELTILNVVWAPYMTIYPHNHRMWAVIGVYTGREDNIFWRRIGRQGGSGGRSGAQPARCGAARAGHHPLRHQPHPAAHRRDPRLRRRLLRRRAQRVESGNAGGRPLRRGEDDAPLRAGERDAACVVPARHKNRIATRP